MEVFEVRDGTEMRRGRACTRSTLSALGEMTAITSTGEGIVESLSER